MLVNIKQKSEWLLPEIQKYGCLFLCFAEASPVCFYGRQGCKELNDIWRKAISLGYISGDLNHDGDYDDDGEAEVRNHNGVASLFCLGNLRYDGFHHSPDEEIPARVKMVFGRYYYKGSHFVIIDRKKNVAFDPYGQSATVRNGYLKDTRWYYAV